MCGKEGYQSIRYTQEKRNRSKRRFNKWINQFILKYKGKEKEKPPNKLIEALIINFNLNNQKQKTLEIFLTNFRPFTDSQAFNITTILADRSFIHLIIPKNQPISIPVRPVINVIDREQDLFAYITIERYTPKEFYSVIIDIGASKKSTIGYGQYLIYKTTVNSNMDINTTQTGAVNVQFSIGSTILIRLVIVKTRIGLVNFHIVKADTPFLSLPCGHRQVTGLL